MIHVTLSLLVVVGTVSVVTVESVPQFGNTGDCLQWAPRPGQYGQYDCIEQAQASGVECLHQNGRFKHEDPTNCEEYYECDNDISILRKCHDGLFFNEFTGVCDWSSKGFRQGCVKTNGDECGEEWAKDAAKNHVCSNCDTCEKARGYAVTDRRHLPKMKTVFYGTYGKSITYKAIDYTDPDSGKKVKACKIVEAVKTWKCMLDKEAKMYTHCDPEDGQQCTGILKADKTAHEYETNCLNN